MGNLGIGSRVSQSAEGRSEFQGGKKQIFERIGNSLPLSLSLPLSPSLSLSNLVYFRLGNLVYFLFP